MAFCGKCGTQIEVGTKFCPGCGSQLQATVTPAAPVQQAPAAPVQQAPATPVQQAPAAPAQQAPAAPAQQAPAAPAQQAPAAPTFQPPVVPPVAPVQQTPQQAAPEQKNDLAGKIKSLNDTADTTSEFDQADIDSNKLLAALSYLGLLVLIPIFVAKESKFARFHANQGLVLLIASTAYSFAYGIVATILNAINLSFISSLLGLVSIAVTILIIMGIVNVVQGKAKELPVIGKFKVLK